MATIIIDGQQKEIPDGSPIMDACEDLGVPMGCRAGQCGICMITVREGLENLDPKTGEEQDMGLEDNQRLACQAVIRSGTLIAEY
ncbi:MAG TPA: (2Fe-2S)-binding protein [Candidatus Hydrogenedentes bacterium]|nr:(2Fe-2S)-binding protein [Candidatus Hydrogenedentota bacterium]